MLLLDSRSLETSRLAPCAAASTTADWCPINVPYAPSAAANFSRHLDKCVPAAWMPSIWSLLNDAISLSPYRLSSPPGRFSHRLTHLTPPLPLPPPSPFAAVCIQYFLCNTLVVQLLSSLRHSHKNPLLHQSLHKRSLPKAILSSEGFIRPSLPLLSTISSTNTVISWHRNLFHHQNPNNQELQQAQMQRRQLCTCVCAHRDGGAELPFPAQEASPFWAGRAWRYTAEVTTVRVPWVEEVTA